MRGLSVDDRKLLMTNNESGKCFFTFVTGNPRRQTSWTIYVNNMCKPCVYIMNELVLSSVRGSRKYYMFCIICATPTPPTTHNYPG